ncbi:MAG: hypothetical protein WCL32_13215 [Planctomycetota bacterium]
MDAIESLLRGPRSELQRLMRASLRGLTATLESALESLPDDPAAILGKDCLHELRKLIDSSEAARVAFGETAQTHATEKDAPRTTAPSPWLNLVQEWQRSHEWTSTCGASLASLAATLTPAELWLLTLRASPELAETWQAQWRRAVDPGILPATTEHWAGPTEHILVPATSAGATEIRLTPTGRVPDFVANLSPGKLAREMLPPVAACLSWIEHDRSLRHMLRSLFRFGTAALADGHRNRYQSVLVDRFQQFIEAESEGNAVQVAQTWVALDESIHSLLHMPPAHPRSAFAAIGKASRSQIAAIRDYAYAAGVEAHLQVLSGRYANLRGSTDPEADVETSEGGTPGDVVLCSRLFLKLDGTSHPGRVVYRPR